MKLATLIIQIVTIIGVISSWFLIPYLTEKFRKRSEIGLSQYHGMSEIHSRTAKTFYGLEQKFTQLMRKYNTKAGQEEELKNKMSPDEKDEVNKIIDEINLLLAKMFIVMPDDKYKVIHETIKTESIKLKDLRENLIIAMRQTQFPNTTFKAREDIRLLHNLK